MKKSSLILLGAIAFFAGTVVMPLALQAGPTITATLMASPSSLTAYCPATIKFTGAIKVDNVIKAPVAIQYKFIRSDGGSTAPITLNCPSAGVYPVNTTWTIGATYSGWEAIEVISPVAVKSDKAGFSLTCLPKPYIDMSNTSFPLSYEGDLYIDGKNFGASQGNRSVSFDGQPVLPKPGWSVKKWSDWRIVLNVKICDIILWDHTYQIAITEGGKVISNVLAIQYMYPICTPGGWNSAVVAGQKVTVNVRNLPASPAGFKLKLGQQGNAWGTGLDLAILTWQGAAGCNPGTITATVPLSATPGTGMLYLHKGNTLCSYDNSCAQIVVTTLKPIQVPLKK
jgi:hypothetical protein